MSTEGASGHVKSRQFYLYSAETQQKLCHDSRSKPHSLFIETQHSSMENPGETTKSKHQGARTDSPLREGTLKRTGTSLSQCKSMGKKYFWAARDGRVSCNATVWPLVKLALKSSVFLWVMTPNGGY